MIAASVPESEDVIKVLLRAGADMNEKSCVFSTSPASQKHA